MSDYISKWHKELSIFSKIKPLIILEGNVLDSYQYPEEGSTPKGSILRWISSFVGDCLLISAFKRMIYSGDIFCSTVALPAVVYLFAHMNKTPCTK